MAIYLNWKKFDQPVRDGSIPIHGKNVGDAIVLTSGVASAVAPSGAQYGAVTSSAAFSVKASNLKHEETTYTENYQANAEANIFEVIPGKTTITATDL